MGVGVERETYMQCVGVRLRYCWQIGSSLSFPAPWVTTTAPGLPVPFFFLFLRATTKSLKGVH